MIEVKNTLILLSRTVYVFIENLFELNVRKVDGTWHDDQFKWIQNETSQSQNIHISVQNWKQEYFYAQQKTQVRNLWALHWSLKLIYLWAQQMTKIWVRCFFYKMSEMFPNESYYKLQYTQNALYVYYHFYEKGFIPNVQQELAIKWNKFKSLDWLVWENDHQNKYKM